MTEKMNQNSNAALQSEQGKVAQDGPVTSGDVADIADLIWQDLEEARYQVSQGWMPLGPERIIEKHVEAHTRRSVAEAVKPWRGMVERQIDAGCRFVVLWEEAGSPLNNNPTEPRTGKAIRNQREVNRDARILLATSGRSGEEGEGT